MSTPLFPGGVAVSRLSVYAWQAEDGHHGGSPHLHTASSEGYVVTAGAGEVHTVSAEGRGVRRLIPGEVVWFSPGTVHRLVNHGGLELVVVMQNAGLPEAGDAVLTFPAAVLDDPPQYAAAAALPIDASDEERSVAARARRDLAVRGYLELIDALGTYGPRALDELHARAARLVQPRIARWRTLWEQTVRAETARTDARLAQLAEADPVGLREASVAHADRAADHAAYGMCGRLQTWQWPLPDGMPAPPTAVRPD